MCRKTRDDRGGGLARRVSRHYLNLAQLGSIRFGSVPSNTPGQVLEATTVTFERAADHEGRGQGGSFCISTKDGILPIAPKKIFELCVNEVEWVTRSGLRRRRRLWPLRSRRLERSGNTNGRTCSKLQSAKPSQAGASFPALALRSIHSAVNTSPPASPPPQQLKKSIAPAHKVVFIFKLASEPIDPIVFPSLILTKLCLSTPIHTRPCHALMMHATQLPPSNSTKPRHHLI